jgi:hypothetical protein
MWKVYRWSKGEWIDPAEYKKRGVGWKPDFKLVSEVEAQDILIDFFGDTTVLQYSCIDGKRINSWLARNKKSPLKNFFDLGSGVCYSKGKALTLFGPNGISRSVNAQLKTILKDLFVLGGLSNVRPKNGTAAYKNGLFPHLTEIKHKGRCNSDDTLDVQKLFNLYAVIRRVYEIATTSS